MATAVYSPNVSQSFAGRVATQFSHDTRELISLGRQRGWGFSVLGNAPMIEEPVRLGDWLMVPAHQDSSPVPDRALARVQAIYAAGIRPKGFVMVHEAPKLLPAPADIQNGPTALSLSLLSPELKSKLKKAGTIVGSLLVGVAIITGIAALAVMAIVAAGFLLLPLAVVVGATGIDPILIAVTEDGYWVEIDRWIAEG